MGKNKKENKSPVYLDLEDGSKVKVSVDNYLSDEDIAAKKLGELIRKLRKEKRYGLRGLAKEIIVKDKQGDEKGMSHSNLSHIENGNVWTTKEILKQIADVLDYDLDKMLAIRNEVNSDIENIIIEQSDAVPEFLRTAKNLTAEDWKKLTEQVKSMKKDNNNDWKV